MPAPTFAAVASLLYERGWRAGHGGDVMVAPLDRVLATVPARADHPPVEFLDEPDADWLAAYHYRGGALPPVAVAILRGGNAAFARLRRNGTTAAICRLVVDGAWVGITAMEVDPGHRRGGFGRALLREVVAEAAARGSRRAWLQVDPENLAAHRLYATAGFVRHHDYRYVRQPG